MHLLGNTAHLNLCKSTSAKRQSTNSQPQTSNPKPQTPNPQTPNPKPQTPNLKSCRSGTERMAPPSVLPSLNTCTRGLGVGGWGRHTSHVTPNTSHVTRHTSHVTRHTCHVTLTLLVMSMASLPVIALACSCAPCSQSVRRRCAAGEGAGMRCACGVASVWFVV